MKSTKYVLLLIGLAALAVSFYGLIKGDALLDHVISIVCGLSLLFGYFQINKLEKIKSDN